MSFYKLSSEKGKYIHIGQDAFGPYVMESKNPISLQLAINEKHYYDKLISNVVQKQMNYSFMDLPDNIRDTIASYINVYHLVVSDSTKDITYRKNYLIMIKEKVHNYIKSMHEKKYQQIVDWMNNYSKYSFDKEIVEKYSNKTILEKLLNFYQDFSRVLSL